MGCQLSAPQHPPTPHPTIHHTHSMSDCTKWDVGLGKEGWTTFTTIQDHDSRRSEASVPATTWPAFSNWPLKGMNNASVSAMGDPRRELEMVITKYLHATPCPQ